MTDSRTILNEQHIPYIPRPAGFTDDQYAKLQREWRRQYLGEQRRDSRGRIIRPVGILNVSRFICRVCGGSGTLVSLAPARGYACASCVAKHGKAALIEAVLAKEAESVVTMGAPT